MKVTSVQLYPENAETAIEFSFKDPRNVSPYNVMSIGGLDADNIVAKNYGSSFFTLTQASREITILVRLNPDFASGETYSDLRDALQRVIAASRTGTVVVQFLNGEEVQAGLSGLVTKFETNPFSQDQEVQITLQCRDAMLRSPKAVGIDGSLLNPASVNFNDDISTAPHGFTFIMTIKSAIDSLKFTDPADPSWSFKITPVGGFLADDVLAFSSETNAKFLYIVRDDVEIHLADVIASGSIWPIMFPGRNQFAVDQPTAVAWYLIGYYPTFWGI